MSGEGVVTVRAATDGDDLDALNEGHVLWMGQRGIRDAFAAGGDVPKGIFVGELDGRPVAYGHAVGVGMTSGFRGMGLVYVLPQYRRRGVGTALWQAVLEVCSPDRVPGVATQIDDDDGTSRRVIVNHGGQLAGLHIQSELDLGQLNDLYPPLRSQLPAELKLVLLPSDADEQTWRRFTDLFVRLSQDTPDRGEGAEDMPYEVLRAMVAAPWQAMVAWDGDQMIGFTAVLVRDAQRRELNTLLTAVSAEYRGRGVATALKFGHTLELRDRGWNVIVTQNMEGNEPILASNRRLGFRPVRRIRDVIYDHP